MPSSKHLFPNSVQNSMSAQQQEQNKPIVGPRSPCPCSVCKGTLRCLSTIRKHRRRDNGGVAAARITKPGIKSNPIQIKNEPEEHTMPITMQESTIKIRLNKPTKRKDAQSRTIKAEQLSGMPTITQSTTQTFAPQVHPENSCVNTTTTANAEYTSLYHAYIALQRRCGYLEQQLHIEWTAKAHILNRLDYMVDNLAPKPLVFDAEYPEQPRH